jgi:hypothetical protein
MGSMEKRPLMGLFFYLMCLVIDAGLISSTISSGTKSNVAVGGDGSINEDAGHHLAEPCELNRETTTGRK